MERWWIIFPAVILTCAERYKGECFVMSPSKQRVLPLCLPPCLSTQPQFYFEVNMWCLLLWSCLWNVLECEGKSRSCQKLPKFMVGESLFQYSLSYSLHTGSTNLVFGDPSRFPSASCPTEDQKDNHFWNAKNNFVSLYHVGNRYILSSKRFNC